MKTTKNGRTGTNNKGKGTEKSYRKKKESEKNKIADHLLEVKAIDSKDEVIALKADKKALDEVLALKSDKKTLEDNILAEKAVRKLLEDENLALRNKIIALKAEKQDLENKMNESFECSDRDD